MQTTVSDIASDYFNSSKPTFYDLWTPQVLKKLFIVHLNVWKLLDYKVSSIIIFPTMQTNMKRSESHPKNNIFDFNSIFTVVDSTEY